MDIFSEPLSSTMCACLALDRLDSETRTRRGVILRVLRKSPGVLGVTEKRPELGKA